MLGKMTVQWCPACKAWNRSSHAGHERIDGVADGGAHGAVQFTYQRNDHQCLRCEGAFSTTSHHQCHPHHKWHVEAAMNAIRRTLSAQSEIQPAS